MSRDKDSLLDIINAARQILRYTSEISWREFLAAPEKQDAVLYRILVMGEATKRLSADFRSHFVLNTQKFNGGRLLQCETSLPTSMTSWIWLLFETWLKIRFRRFYPS